MRKSMLKFLESTLDGACIVAWDHGIDYVNPPLRQEFGEPGAQRCFEYLHDRDEPCPGCQNERVRAGEWIVRDVVFARSGKHFEILEAPLEESAAPESEGPASKLVIFRDITERKLREDALRRSQRELTIRNRISEVFLSAPEEEMYADVLEVILEGLASPFGFFGYIDEDGAFISPSLTRGIWDRCEMPQKSIVFPRETWTGVWGRSLVERRTICQNRGPLRVPEGHIPLSRALCVPLLFRDQLLGQVTVANKETEYTDEDIEVLESVASKIAMILTSRLELDRQSRARRRAEEEVALLKRQLRGEGAFAGIVGRDPQMLELFETIREVAAVDVPVLIQGESGTGKELVAAAIHSQGPRADHPFVPVNCSALPETLLESELFGHVKGAFTGAIRDKKGRFELANGGTIFLDEVGDLSPSIQVSLLRVLQEGTIERVGDEAIRPIDARVISATNRDLHRLVAAGKFREDLFYRLCVVPITVPPLRERRHDIPLLADHVLRQICSETGKRVALSRHALDALSSHLWPGNVRELQNAIYYAVVKSKGSVIDVGSLPAGIVASSGAALQSRRRGRKQKLDSDRVARAMREVGGNKQKAARLLGVSRATLYKFLSRL